MLTKKNTLVDDVVDHISGRMNDLETSKVLKAMQIFFIVNLPVNKEDLATYGEAEVTTLCNYFHANLERMDCQVDEIIHTEWPAMKIYMYKHKERTTEFLHKKLFSDSLKEKFKNILMLVEIILVIPTSSAICERGFSAMARIKSDWRAKLKPEMLDRLMAIAVSGPPVEQYKCDRAINIWARCDRKRRPQFNADDEAVQFEITADDSDLEEPSTS